MILYIRDIRVGIVQQNASKLLAVYIYTPEYTYTWYSGVHIYIHTHELRGRVFLLTPYNTCVPGMTYDTPGIIRVHYERADRSDRMDTDAHA